MEWRRPIAFSWFLAIACGAPLPTRAGPAPDYLRDIKPVLASHCYACHGPLKQRSNLRLDTVASMLKGGDRGPVIVPGRAAQSLLLGAASGSAGFRMPPEGEGTRLGEAEMERIQAWIDSCARFPPDEQPAGDPRRWWSYQPVRRPAVPPPSGGGGTSGWARNPIDAFIAAEHGKRSLTPRPPASPAALLRRVYLDLIGLPPTREELHAFLADSSERAYQEVVERLLSSPRHGERWGRHWMDVWRYSDWYGSRGGNEIRYSQRHIWRWRDWIVESLNADKGYDRMVLEMLAGDEIAPADPAVTRATGFLGRNWYKFDRNVWLFDTVEHASLAFLGLTLKCARCHDHKFDPITQVDYYRFRAFFEPHDVRTDPLSALGGTEKDATLGQVLKDGLARVYDRQPAPPTYLFTRGDSRRPDETQPLAPGVPASLGVEAPEVRPVALPLESFSPWLAPAIVTGLLQEAEAKVAQAGRDGKSLPGARADLAALQARIAAGRAKALESPDAVSLALAAARAERQAALAHAEEEALVAGDEKRRLAAQKALEEARAAILKQDPACTPLGPEYPRTSTGRRLALARWIVDPRNPRTARIAVNHIWLRHFGEALVPTVSNFGLNGMLPSHPELLDWLAAELVEGGWSMKRLHRLMVTSSAYRMSSAEGEPGSPDLALDRENRFLWRANSRRLESEAVRDSLLEVSGQLDTTLGGPEIEESRAQESRRRSLYFRGTPNEKTLFLELFDQANPNECYRRHESVVPQQSLALLNSALSLNQARLLAGKLSAEVGAGEAQETAFVEAAYEQVLSRPPAPAEVEACRRFLARESAVLGSGALTAYPGGGGPPVTPPAREGRLRAREDLVHVLFSHNDFVTVR
jgi:hypothetical protein